MVDKPGKTVYPDDSMLSDESDGTSFPAHYSGPAGREPDNPMGPAQGVTVRRPRKTNPVTPNPSHRPLTWDEWLEVRADVDREHKKALFSLGRAEPEYFDKYLRADRPQTSATGHTNFMAPPTGSAVREDMTFESEGPLGTHADGPGQENMFSAPDSHRLGDLDQTEYEQYNDNNLRSPPRAQRFTPKTPMWTPVPLATSTRYRFCAGRVQREYSYLSPARPDNMINNRNNTDLPRKPHPVVQDTHESDNYSDGSNVDLSDHLNNARDRSSKPALPAQDQSRIQPLRSPGRAI